jgi:hypothetical protein
MDQELKGAVSLTTAIATGSAAWLETFNLIVSIASGVAAFVASCFAIYYYIKKGNPE